MKKPMKADGVKTLQDICDAIAGVTAIALNDNEGAHVEEDRLYIRILQLIADGAFKTKAEMQEAAALGVQLSKLEYRRWYA